MECSTISGISKLTYGVRSPSIVGCEGRTFSRAVAWRALSAWPAPRCAPGVPLAVSHKYHRRASRIRQGSLAPSLSLARSLSTPPHTPGPHALATKLRPRRSCRRCASCVLCRGYVAAAAVPADTVPGPTPPGCARVGLAGAGEWSGPTSMLRLGKEISKRKQSPEAVPASTYNNRDLVMRVESLCVRCARSCALPLRWICLRAREAWPIPKVHTKPQRHTK